MRTWFLMTCYWRILFQKEKWIHCGKQYPTRAIHRLEKPSIYTTCICVEFGQTLWPLLRNLSCSQDPDHVQSTYICCSYTGSTQKHIFHLPKMFYSYTRNSHKNMFDRINAPSSCKYIPWKVSIVEKEAWAMQKLWIKEEKRKKSMKKWTSVRDI
jgi:hypothetical protein